VADATVDMSAADATATADHDADLAALLAAGKRCKVCAPAVPRDGVRGGRVPACERAGVGLLTQVGDRIELRLYSKKLDDDRYTYLKPVRVVEAADIAGFDLLELQPPLPRPPKALCTPPSSLPISLTLITAIALVRPSYKVNVPGETQQSVFRGATSEQPLGILSGSIVAGRVDRDGGWGMVAKLMSLVGEGGHACALRAEWESAATDERGAIVLCYAAASACAARNGLLTPVPPLMCNLDRRSSFACQSYGASLRQTACPCRWSTPSAGGCRVSASCQWLDRCRGGNPSTPAVGYVLPRQVARGSRTPSSNVQIGRRASSTPRCEAVIKRSTCLFTAVCLLNLIVSWQVD
jgi:hypothetical protein